MPSKHNDSEQDILDACWSGTSLNDKLKSKLLERMERVKKAKQFRAPSLARRSKPPMQSSSAAKNKNKSKLILMVQESSNLKLPVPKVTSCKNKDQVFTNRFAPSPSIPESRGSKDQGRPSLGSVSRSLQDGLPQETQKGMRRDASAYLTLRDQLSKLTMEIQGNNCSVDDSVSSKKQRRTRKERKKGQFDRDSSMVVDSGGFGKNLLNCTQEVHKRSQDLLSSIPKPKIGLKRPLAKLQKHTSDLRFAKENAKPNLHSSSSKLLPLKKGTDTNRHVARKYLGDMYAKVMHKVRDIEKSTKTGIPQKKTLSKCASSKQDLRKLSQSKIPRLNCRYSKGDAAK